MPNADANPDRAGAIAHLRSAFDDGKLDRQGYDDRVARALAATAQTDLDQLVADLPGYAPTVPVFEPYPGDPRSAGSTVSDQGVWDPTGDEPATTVREWTDPDGSRHYVERTEEITAHGTRRVREHQFVERGRAVGQARAFLASSPQFARLDDEQKRLLLANLEHGQQRQAELAVHGQQMQAELRAHAQQLMMEQLQRRQQRSFGQRFAALLVVAILIISIVAVITWA